MNKFEFPKALCVVDGSALAYRAFYAIKPLSNSAGEPTHAIMGFFKSLVKTLEKFNSCKLQLIIAWDSRESSRKEVYSQYKATRLAMPDSLASQFKAIKQICDACQITQLSHPGLEADDLIYACTQQADLPVLVVSPDKDLLQLVGGKNFVYDPSTDILYDCQEVVKKYELEPEHLKLYYALLGDASDNIPGVAGIGKKTALEVAKLFSTPEQLLNGLNRISPKICDKILADQENFLLSFKLFSLIDHPIDKELWDTPAFDIKDLLRAQELFERFEIKTVLNKKLIAQLEIKNTFDSNTYNWFEYQNVKSPEDLGVLKGATVIGVDTETTGLDWKTDSLVAITLSDGTNNFFIDAKAEKIDEILAWLDQELFANQKITKVLHNAKFDLHFLRQAGIKTENFAAIFDTLICAQIIAQGLASEKINLKALAKKHFGLNLPSYKELTAANIESPNNELFQRYAVCDAIICLKLYFLFQSQLTRDARELFQNIEMPLLKILLEMEQAGILIDQERLNEISKKVDAQLMEVEVKLKGLLEAQEYPLVNQINFLSPKQVGELLFGFLNLDRFLSVNADPSTDKETLDHLAKFHPVPHLISQLRGLAKLKSTYLEGFLKHIWTDGKVHTNYSQTNVATGRLSSENPNLQNLPLDIAQNGELSFGYRSIFLSDPGKQLVSADYSQIELRVLAHVTADPILIDAFANGQDVHSTTAKEIFNLPSLDSVTKEQRQIGKRINFGIVYGLGGFGLSQQLEIPKGQAQEYINSFFNRYKGVRSWIDQTLETARSNGFVKTIFGRTRALDQINDRNAILRKASERMAINCIIQGSAAEVVKLAMISIDNQIKQTEWKNQAQILLQVHDELVFQVPHSMCEEFMEIVKFKMENAVKFSVPLEVDISSGPNLLDLN